VRRSTTKSARPALLEESWQSTVTAKPKPSAPLRRPTRWPAPSYRVRLAAHSLEDGRWKIPIRIARVPAADARHAAEIVVREAHGAAGCPPWCPLLAKSLEHTAVERA
jgi:hypothetical protein